ncbi:4Fe-4S ferredoxin [candidate division WOR-3 bacterium]|uniref:4Fe-4S ferredoxin n=1 Tax=candidate division WOR-3 bacterium TaxID=2052148 RepID=A0A660SK31_UNCW3|nr:MAG: 4Fe-4S ferredoxin [candidate division WOR-3 bacterium]
MRKLLKKDLPRLIEWLKTSYLLYGPTEYGFAPIADHTPELITPIRPPKGIFFPQYQVLFRYDGKVPKSKGIGLFGVRPCDAKGLLILNRIFTQGPYRDNYWQDQYQSGIIIGIGCNQPQPTCFCHWFGIGPFGKEGCDLFLTDIGDGFLIEAVSKKGEDLISSFDPLLPPTDQDLKRRDEIVARAEAQLKDGIDPKLIKERLDNLWESPIWGELAERCLSCALCTYLCPTCHCFDIQDEEKARVRIWDSCLFPLFTQEASGHNPRPEIRDRLRQRIMHKFNYLYLQYKEAGCVGCGRCVIFCPVNLDLRELMRRILDEG